MPDPVAHHTVMDPVEMTLARVYADALLGALGGDAEAEEVASQLHAIAVLLDQVEGFEALLTGALIARQDRIGLVRRIFGDRCDERVEAVLSIMAGNGRMELVREMSRQFRAALDLREHKIDVTVTTAAPVDQAQRLRLGHVLGEVLGAEPLLTMQVREGLLGGMVVRIGDRVFDASIAGELHRLRQSLAGRSRA
jgi:F-type H+-transporting ATPase subunit delta